MNATFDELVDEALASLPDWVLAEMDNVQVFVEDEPPSDRGDLLGLYEGIPLTQRGIHYAGVVPDRITLYRRNIERDARRDPDRLKAVVRDTVVHEIAHHFGISDERLSELGHD